MKFWQNDKEIEIAEHKLTDEVTETQVNVPNNEETNNKDIDLKEHKVADVVTEVKVDDFRNEMTSTHKLQIKEISWNDSDYLQKVHLQMPVEGQVLKLQRTASVGPCFRPGMPYEGPSGFKLYMPGKNFTNDFKPVQSGISIRVSKTKFKTNNETDVMEGNGFKNAEKGQIDKIHVPKTLREKLNNMWIKIRHSLNNL